MIAYVLSLFIGWSPTCADWRHLPNGDWATIRKTPDPGGGTIEIDDLYPGAVTAHGVDVFSAVDKACK